MTTRRFPSLDLPALAATRDGLHAYARVLGGWMTAGRAPRKHWWQGSLRPSVRGLTTGTIYGPIDVELELDLLGSVLRVRTSETAELTEPLRGQPAAELAASLTRFLVASGIDAGQQPDAEAQTDTRTHAAYSADAARAVAGSWSAVSAAMETLRAGIREETSPIQLWPHHFDLSMVWLPGGKVAGHDPDSVEQADYADRQMNFGLVLGDDAIGEPYFYVTAYPTPDAFAALSLPENAVWRSEGFTGVTLTYERLLASGDPARSLLDLWRGLLAAGRNHLRG